MLSHHAPTPPARSIDEAAARAAGVVAFLLSDPLLLGEGRALDEAEIGRMRRVLADLHSFGAVQPPPGARGA